MKVELADLKSAVSWIEKNSNDVQIDIQIQDGQMSIKCSDKYQVSVEIKVLTAGTRRPRIIKEDALNEKG